MIHPSDEFLSKLIARSGLVRVTAKDGSVWHVRPSSLEFYTNLENQFAFTTKEASHETPSYQTRV